MTELLWVRDRVYKGIFTYNIVVFIFLFVLMVVHAQNCLKTKMKT